MPADTARTGDILARFETLSVKMRQARSALGEVVFGQEEVIDQMLGGFVNAPAIDGKTTELANTLRAILGERRFRAAQSSLEAMMLLRDEPVLLVSPRVITVR